MMPIRWSRRGLLQGLVPVAATGFLAGCGFHPVYMATASGSPGPAQREMAAIEVGRIPDRPGQLLRQALQQRLGSDSDSVAPRYTLAVDYSISGEGIAVTPDSTATRLRLIGRATWTLASATPPHAAVTRGLARAFTGMNIFDQQYFAADMETEAQQRVLAREVASQIAQELAVFFRRRAGMG